MALTARAALDVWWRRQQIVTGQDVATPAVRLGGIARGNGVSAQRVRAASDRLKVCRIHAGSVAAQVIQLESGRNRADAQLVGHTMRKPMTFATDAEGAVALGLTMGRP